MYFIIKVRGHLIILVLHVQHLLYEVFGNHLDRLYILSDGL